MHPIRLEKTCDVVELSSRDDYRRLLLNDKDFANRTAASMASSRGLHPSLVNAPTMIPLSSGGGENPPDTLGAASSLQLSSTFFTPLGSQTDSQLVQAWEQLASVAVQSGAARQPGPCSIPVLFGRALSVPQAAGGAAWFRFEDLCAGPLGPADYVALASAFHTVFITDVPVMSMQVIFPPQGSEMTMLAPPFYIESFTLTPSFTGAGSSPEVHHPRG